MSFLDKMVAAKDNGLLAEMYTRGLIDHIPSYYLDIYLDKTNKGLTYKAIAERLGISISTVVRACKAIKPGKV